MAKYLLLGVNSLLFLFIGLFSADEVTVKHTLPVNAQPGTEFVAEFTITKSVAIQFGKMQVDLPEGVTAEESDSKGGQFSVNETHAKVLWMQFPSENETTVKIKFKVGQNAAAGVKSMGIKFLYVVGTNEKKSVELTHEITISSTGQTGTIATTTTTPTTTTTTTTTTTPADTSKFGGAGDEPQAAVSAKRTITKDEASGNYKVEITIRKDAIKGFAKYTDVLPEGLVASKGEMSGGGSFKFADKKATIIWATLPKDEVITANYWIKATGTFTENPTVTGTFSYLENETTMKLNAPNAVVPVVADAMAGNKTDNTTETNTVSTTNTVATTNTVTETNTVAPTNTVAETNTVATTSTVTETNTVAATNTATTTQTDTKTTTDSNAGVTSSNVVFHVQLGAYKNPPDATYFKTKFNINDNVNTDMHQGLTKFLAGKFGAYKDSRDYRETVKSKGVQDAFVTAYNGGKRITVQEALMIVNQKWFR